MVTQRYREQHEALRQIAGEIPTVASEVSERAVRGWLIKLIGTLRAHLGLEDSYLYPQMLKHPDSAVREKAQRFQQEMGGLSQAVDEFHKRWSTINAIDSDPAGFVAQWAKIRAALVDRMEREDDDLYTMLDRVSGMGKTA